MRTELLRFNGNVERDSAIDAWMKKHGDELGIIAHGRFEAMRKCGDGVVRSCMMAVRLHVWAMRQCVHFPCNVGFFHGAESPDPAHLLQDTGKFVRHIKLRPGHPQTPQGLSRLIDAAHSDIKTRLGNG